ncbi:MAG: DinB family protein [Balneolaceae bacterium]
MMDLNQLILYDDWANQRVYSVLEKLPESTPRTKIFGLFAHLLSTQKVWYNRIKSADEKAEIWPELSLIEMAKLMSENPKKLKSLISKKHEEVSYLNSSGNRFQNTIEEILFHLIIHGQHHRAQIAILLRQAGTTPPATDYIFYLRE